jgi:Uma2 family endonuclease
MSAVFTPTRHKLSVDDYHKLGEAGILNEDSRVELIEGELIDMAPIAVAHMTAVNRLNRLLMRAVADLGVVSIQNPVTVPPHSEPQPDVAVLRPGMDRVDAGLPGPADVLLLIEVSDTTVAYDRGTKLQLYARAGIVECWLVNLQSASLEVHRGPTPHGYSQTTELRPGDVIAPLNLPAVKVEGRGASDLRVVSCDPAGLCACSR